MKLLEFLGAERAGDEWTFEIGRELHGAFGGAFGGVVAAATIVAARSAAEGRIPAAIDCRFVRGLPAGTATVRPTVVHAGRSLANVSVDLAGPDGRLATRSTISLVDPAALAAIDDERGGGELVDYDAAAPWPRAVPAPILDVLDPRNVDGATAVRVPWDDPGWDAEAICLAADMCVGPPVAAVAMPHRAPHPNPDLSLRVCGTVDTDVVVGRGTLERVDRGLAIVSITVTAAGRLVAAGVSSSMLLRT